MFIWFIIIQMHINTHTPPLLFLTSSVLSFWHCSSWGLSLPSSLKFAFSHSPQELELSQYVNHCIKLSGGCAAVFFSFQLGDTFIHSVLCYPIRLHPIVYLCCLSVGLTCAIFLLDTFFVWLMLSSLDLLGTYLNCNLYSVCSFYCVISFGSCAQNFISMELWIVFCWPVWTDWGI